MVSLGTNPHGSCQAIISFGPIIKAYDLTQLAVGGKIAAQRPDIIIHAAAFTNVDGCERDPNAAFQVNARGTRRVAEGAANTSVRLVYVSTDYVFDGMQTRP